MNKSELIAAMAEKSGLSKKDAEKALNSFEESVKEELATGGKVQLVGFGTFEVVERKPRIGRNPKTKEEILIEGGMAPKFKAGKNLKEAINQAN